MIDRILELLSHIKGELEKRRYLVCVVCDSHYVPNNDDPSNHEVPPLTEDAALRSLPFRSGHWSNGEKKCGIYFARGEDDLIWSLSTKTFGNMGASTVTAIGEGAPGRAYIC